MGNDTQYSNSGGSQGGATTDEFLEIFGISMEEADSYREACRTDNIRKKIEETKKDLEHEYDYLGKIKKLVIGKSGMEREFIYEFINETNDTIDHLEKKIKYFRELLSPKKGREMIDIEAIRENVKIKTVLQLHGIAIGNNKFFSIRQERTPSCYLYEDKNRWHDFGSSTGGSVIDLYIAINNCSVSEAIKYLNTII
jgi:hypothetical protein